MNIFELDYAFKDKDKWVAHPKELPTYVIAENVEMALQRAKDWEDDNLTVHKVNMILSGNVAIQKALKGLTGNKAKAAETAPVAVMDEASSAPVVTDQQTAGAEGTGA